MLIIQTQTLTVDGVDFDATLWFDESDNTVDIEAYAVLPSLSPVTFPDATRECEANVYTVPISEFDTHFEIAARAAIAAA